MSLAKRIGKAPDDGAEDDARPPTENAMIETHFYSRDDEVISTVRYEDGVATFGGPRPRLGERIAAELTVMTAKGPLAFKDAPVAWLRRVPYEMRSGYGGAIVVADDEPADDPSLMPLPR